ncbi:MAG: dihydrofolate reductase family protein [Legionella sp.]|jgi:dihydrofolate reductase
MQPKVSVFIATSLDGYIAREDGSIDWLMEANQQAPAGEDGGYKAFISTVDMLVMGRVSFEKVQEFDPWPYTNLPVIVLSSEPIDIPNHLKENVTNSDKKPHELMYELAEQNIQHIYLDGGITIQNFLRESLVDEITITIVPVLLGSGRPLFGSLTNDIKLERLSSRSIDGGWVQMHFRIIK